MDNFRINLDLNDNSKKNKENKENKQENNIVDEVTNIFNNSIENNSQKMLMLSIMSHIVLNSMKKN